MMILSNTTPVTNTTDKAPNSAPEWNPSAPTVTMVAQVLMFVAISTVNVLTLMVMTLTPKLRTIPNTYIAALALSDLVVSLNQLIAIPWTHPELHDAFEERQELCLFFKILLHFNELTSILTIAIIGLDRFLYIRHPFWYVRVVTKNKVKMAVLVVWLSSLVIAVPIRLTNLDSKYPGCDAKALLYDSTEAGYVHGALYFIICSSLFICYGIVIKTALKQTRAIKASRGHHAKKQSISSERMNSDEARLSLKIAKKMAGVFIMLFLCWTPYIVIGLIGPAKVNPQLIMVSGFLAALNSAANFGVYALGDREFRNATVKMICCRSGRPGMSDADVMEYREGDSRHDCSSRPA